MMANVGFTETVVIHGPSGKKAIKARIDTGAKSNSIDRELAQELGIRPGRRTTVVKSAMGCTERPVVTIKVEIGGKEMRGRFTIADRKILRYRVLIGRNILKNGFTITGK